MSRSAASSKSRRKQKDEAPGRKPINKLYVGAQLGAVALVIVLFLVVSQNGGAPQAGRAVGDARPQTTDWSLSATEQGAAPVVLCAPDKTCSLDDLWAAEQRNATCAFEADLWLGSPDNPWWVFDVALAFTATFSTGDLALNETGIPNITTETRTGTGVWDGGVWWRGEKEVTTIRVDDVPCDIWQASIDVTLTGKKWTGGTFTSEQHSGIVVHRDVKTGDAGVRPPP